MSTKALVSLLPSVCQSCEPRPLCQNFSIFFISPFHFPSLPLQYLHTSKAFESAWQFMRNLWFWCYAHVNKNKEATRGFFEVKKVIKIRNAQGLVQVVLIGASISHLEIEPLETDTAFHCVIYLITFTWNQIHPPTENMGGGGKLNESITQQNFWLW